MPPKYPPTAPAPTMSNRMLFAFCPFRLLIVAAFLRRRSYGRTLRYALTSLDWTRPKVWPIVTFLGRRGSLAGQ
jgi:hypothetical protein